jgi:hypothetical protein
MDRIRTLGTAMVLLPAPAPPAAAQIFWMEQRQIPSVSVEVLKPVLSGEEGTSPFTAGSFATLRIPSGERMLVVVDLPVAHYNPDDPSSGRTETALGNPYLGVEQRVAATGLNLELGARIPVAPDEDENARLLGVLADLDRWEAFVSDAIPITLAGNYRLRDPDGLGFRVRLAGSAWASTRSGTEFLLSGALLLSYDNAPVGITAGLSARFVATGEGSFADRSYRQVVVDARYAGGRVRPGLNLRIPVDGPTDELVDLVWGCSIDTRLD